MDFLSAPDFLGTPGVGWVTFAGLMLASLVTCFIGVFTGAAGGIVLLGLMATVMPPLALIPVHTVVMLGSGVTRTMIMWRHVMRPAVLPPLCGKQESGGSATYRPSMGYWHSSCEMASNWPSPATAAGF